MPAREQLEVAEGEAPITLGDFLERRWPEIHRTYWRRLIQAGGVRVNFLPGDARRRLKPGDIVEVRHSEDAPRRHAPPAETAWRAIHVDAELVVAAKAHGARFDAAAVEALGVGPELRPVLRVEAEASGAVVFARGPIAALEASFAAGDLIVEWLALVEGVVAGDATRIERPLGPDRRRRGFVRAVDADAKGARAATTEVAVVERFRRHTLVRARPRTERGHQLRAHLAGARHPIVGDLDYGANAELRVSDLKRRYKAREGVVERPLLARLFLHADLVRLERPGEPELKVEVPLPRDLEVTLTTLRRAER